MGIERKVSVKSVPADWATYGKRAGMLRNAAMLELHKPDLVVAFRGGRGTANMVSLARKARVKVQQEEI